MKTAIEKMTNEKKAALFLWAKKTTVFDTKNGSKNELPTMNFAFKIFLLGKNLAFKNNYRTKYRIALTHYPDCMVSAIKNLVYKINYIVSILIVLEAIVVGLWCIMSKK